MPKLYTVSKFLDKAKSKIKELFAIIFPSTLNEWTVFMLSAIGYGILAYLIASNFSIVFDTNIPWDAYFSFDNRAIVMNGGGFERHPFSIYFFDQLREFALLISNGKMDATFRVVLSLCSALALSFTNLQLFKYLKNGIKLPATISWLLTVFFSIGVTPILLSFTPETYTYTLPLLLLFNYYSVLKLKQGKKINALALTLSTITIGGLTITNAVKVYIPVVFEKDVFKSWKKIGGAFLRLLIAVGAFVTLFLYRLDFKFDNFLTKTEQQYEKFSEAKIVPWWDMVVSYFFGGNMLFSSFEIRDYHNQQKTYFFKSIFMEPYSSPFLYGFVGIVLALLLWSYIRNFRNKYVQILAISFFVDIIIHCALKFGLHTAYIYGGHFIFVYPLLIGWLFYSYKNSPKMLSFLFCLLIVLISYLGINNYLRFLEFQEFLNNYY